MNMLPMGGKITWLAVIGTAAFAVNDFVNGDVNSGIEKTLYALGALGLGRKIEKNGAAQ